MTNNFCSVINDLVRSKVGYISNKLSASFLSFVETSGKKLVFIMCILIVLNIVG